jgi:sugar phosphate permease
VPRLLAGRLPFYYGWVVLASLCCAGFSRQGLGIATLSIFVEPLAQEFGWTRTAISGAASLAGLLAAFVSPLIGPILDRQGSRFILCAAVLINGLLLLLLSLTPSLLIFYLLYGVARLNWASPFDLGIYGALNNWFVARRTAASAVATLAQSAGLVAMPLIAQFAIVHDGWRAGWFVLGVVTLVVGFVPTWLFLVRRPEDLGLLPDRAVPALSDRAAAPPAEPRFSRAQALRTPAFWLLLSYTVLVYPVQAGISLHQAPLMIERGLDSTVAATIVSFFSLMSAVATIVWGVIPRRVPIRYPMAVSGLAMMMGALLMPNIASALNGYVAAGLFGFGVGGILTLLPVAWADYFGRTNFGAIRSVALSAQVLAQACGPLISGALRDWTGSYQASLHCFAVLAALSVVAALVARQPTRAP